MFINQRQVSVLRRIKPNGEIGGAKLTTAQAMSGGWPRPRHGSIDRRLAYSLWMAAFDPEVVGLLIKYILMAQCAHRVKSRYG
jgi:hypothetical protein